MLNIEKIWYGRHVLSYVLLPVSWLYCLLVVVRKRLYDYGIFTQIHVSVPVIVVGNITAGGTGKTPLVENLVHHFRQQGYTPGIISRGYGGQSKSWPISVTEQSSANMVGDEPVLLARHCHCPIVVGPDRVADAKMLLAQYSCDLIIADDGLQHYRLARTVEIAVLDGIRQLGNGFCIPAGPLRERKQRLNSVDIVVVNQGDWPAAYNMTLQQTKVINLRDHTIVKTLTHFSGKSVHAVAGIGNPSRYFEQLESHGIKPICHPFPDHYSFFESDLDFSDDKQVLMTEKDAVKCQAFAQDNFWYVAVVASLDSEFYNIIEDKIRDEYGQKTT